MFNIEFKVRRDLNDGDTITQSKDSDIDESMGISRQRTANKLVDWIFPYFLTLWIFSHTEVC